MTTVRAIVRGRVQGVNYRAWTQDAAARLGLTGWVRNLPDGTVELEATGPEAAIDSLLAACREGPPAARPTAVEPAPAAPLTELPPGARPFG